LKFKFDLNLNWFVIYKIDLKKKKNFLFEIGSWAEIQPAHYFFFPFFLPRASPPRPGSPRWSRRISGEPNLESQFFAQENISFPFLIDLYPVEFVPISGQGQVRLRVLYE
jgi:hypothetical protein